MDLVASCKEKLAYFRIKELKDVLTQLGISKQGKKQDLIDRIVGALSNDQGSSLKKYALGRDVVAKLVDDTYRKMQGLGATDLASKSQGVSEASNVKLKEEIEDSCHQTVEKTRCPCGSTLPNDSVIKCEDSRCNVWQHMGCVIIPEKPNEDPTSIVPGSFYCELCRLTRADPFWLTMSHPLFPTKLMITNAAVDGSNPVQTVEKTFQLTRADRDLLTKQEFDVQAWCMLLNDKVPFRMQWPQYADLQVNGVPVRAINRPGSQLLGANGRDDGPIITSCTRDGINRISLTACDARVFCFGVRVVKRRTVQQILNMIPKESEGELFEDALARVRRCVGGGTPTENADDSDSDLEVVADFIPVNLRCPMSGSRMKVAGRFKPCVHMGCFDLDVFVEMNQRSRKWQCPICLKNYALENAIIDPYFNRITSKLRNCSEDISEVEVKPDGSWRAKIEGGGDRRGLGDLGVWHAPDGSICVPRNNNESIPNPDAALRQVKQEVGGGPDFHSGGLKLGMKKNRNGIWEISKPDDTQIYSPENNNFHQLEVDVIHMTSSASGSGKDGESPSVNQDGGGNLDCSTNNNGTELISKPYRAPAPALQDAEVIVLSDSDDENQHPISPVTMYTSHHQTDGVGVSVSYNNEIPDSYQDTVFATGGATYPPVFNANDDDYMHMWSLLPSGSSQGGGGPGFQLFGSDADAADMQPGPSYMGSATLLPDSSSVEQQQQHLHGDVSDSLVNNPLAAFGGNDPSLQIFLPSRPTTDASSIQQADESRDQTDVSNGIIQNEDWIELSLGGGGASGGTSINTSINGLTSGGEPEQPKQSDMNSLTAASLLLGMNDNDISGTTKRTRERSDNPFVFPRQKRSVRPRLVLSMGSDSE